MPADAAAASDVLSRSVGIGLPVVQGFALVLARVAGLFSFASLPGGRSLVDLGKVVFSLSLTIALYPFWPKLEATNDPWKLALWVLAEAAMGLTMGLLVALAQECLTFAMQLIATQAGYSYATSIDPNSQADSGVFPVIGQLFAGLLFFALGLDRHIVSALAVSLQTMPPGMITQTDLRAPAESILKLFSGVFVTGVRLSLPVVALLLILDLSLALMGRLNAQLQLLTVAFPAKMLLSLVIVAICAPAMAIVFEKQAQQAIETLQQFVHPPPRVAR
jgi:flagellar biosynthetic protein FliR